MQWLNGLNPFLIRATFESATICKSVRFTKSLNPFLIRATFERAIVFHVKQI